MDQLAAVRRLWLGVVFLLLGLVALVGGLRTSALAEEAYVIGAVVGSEIEYRGAEMLVKEINKQGGVNGTPLKLKVLLDNYEPDQAHAAAESFAKTPDVLAVIGHTTSTVSLAAGSVYREYGVPAITPYSTNDNVTKDNPWYFRTIFKDSFQGHALANYAMHVLKHDKVTIIHDDGAYGIGLAGHFAEEIVREGGTVVERHLLGARARTPEEIEARIQEIIKTVSLGGEEAHKEKGMIFLSSRGSYMAKLVRGLRDAGMKNYILGPDTGATAAFLEGITGTALSGYYARNMVISAPFIFDIGNQHAQRLRARYLKLYGVEPTYQVAYSYDAMSVIVKALETLKLELPVTDIAEARRQMREALAGINSPEEAVDGLTGPLYFDQNGDANAFVNMGVIKQGKLVSAVTQFRQLLHPDRVVDLPKRLDDGDLTKVGDKFLFRSNVVYTGINIRHLDNLDFSEKTFEADFDLWLRSGMPVDASDLVFTNVVGDPVFKIKRQEHSEGGMYYQLFSARGTFKMDVGEGRYQLSYHSLPIQYYHRRKDESALIFVKDYREDEARTLRVYNRTRVLDPSYNWRIDGLAYFQDTLPVNSMGGEFYSLQGGIRLDHSQFNALVLIEENIFHLHDYVSQGWIVIAFCISAIVSLLLFTGLLTKWLKRRHLKRYWFVHFTSTMVALFTGGDLVTDYYTLLPFINESQAFYVLQFVSALYWVAAGFFVNQFVDRVMWHSVGRRSGHGVPVLVRRLSSFIIYLIAAFGIISFVLQQELTSLLATSGIVAMIIGLAVQTNLSNIFSGIAVSFEKPFKIGDMVRLQGGDGNPIVGRVIDMTWRSTKIIKRDNSVVSIPNGQIAGTNINNLTDTHSILSAEMTVVFSPDLEPQPVMQALESAVTNVDGVKSATVRVSLMRPTQVEYSIAVEHSRDDEDEILGELWNTIWVTQKALKEGRKPPVFVKKPVAAAQLNQALQDKQEAGRKRKSRWLFVKRPVKEEAPVSAE